MKFLTGRDVSRSENAPILPISFRYRMGGNLISRMIELYIAKPNNMPIKVNSRSRSSAADGLNHKECVSSSAINIPKMERSIVIDLGLS